MQLFISKSPKPLKKTGFTMIEMLVVVAIIGILSVIGLSSFGSAQAKAKDAKKKSDLAQIARALEVYRNDYDSYPADSAAAGGKIVGCGTSPATSCNWGGSFVRSDVTYMGQMPDDTGSYEYVYDYISATSYALYARLENTQETATEYAGKDCDPTATTTLCNYKVTSPGS